MMTAPPTMVPWFAIQTRHRHEKIVVRQLEFKGYELFLPTYEARRRWSDRIKIVELPMLEGYFFCRLDMANASRVITTPGVIRIVGGGSGPIAVDDAEVEALQRLVISRRQVEPFPYLRVGQAVRIESGPLTGLEGVLHDFRGKSRLIVSVTLLQRSVAVELDRDAVSPTHMEPLAACC
jgi:transcription antitermination factor NusG